VCRPPFRLSGYNEISISHKLHTITIICSVDGLTGALGDNEVEFYNDVAQKMYEVLK
jgi:hypothetical protein